MNTSVYHPPSSPSPLLNFTDVSNKLVKTIKFQILSLMCFAIFNVQTYPHRFLIVSKTNRSHLVCKIHFIDKKLVIIPNSITKTN